MGFELIVAGLNPASGLPTYRIWVMPTPYKCQNQVRVLVGRFGDVAQLVERRFEAPGHSQGFESLHLHYPLVAQW